MAVYFLYFLDSEEAAPFDWQSIMTRADQMIGMFQFRQVIVDYNHFIKKATMGDPLIVHSLDEALKHPELDGSKFS